MHWLSGYRKIAKASDSGGPFGNYPMFLFSRPSVCIGLGIALALQLAASTVARAQNASDIPWNRSLTITRTSSDDDIRNVFRSILQSDGQSVVFGPAVHATVSFHLESVPIQQAFEQLIDEHHLTYSYTPATKTVMIDAAGGGGTEARNTAFVTLTGITYPELVQAVSNLGLGLGGLKYDPASRTLAISGDQERAKQIQSLVADLEAAQTRGGTSIGPEEVKVIPLRFTDVGPSTRQFQGKTITVPGIADTLRSVLGLDEPPGGSPGKETAPPVPASTYGHPRISIDQRTNSVVVQGSPDAIAAVEKIITQLDRPLQMVQIQVLIVTANAGVAHQLGIDWRGSEVNTGGAPNSLAIDTGTSSGATTTSGSTTTSAGTGAQVTVGTNGQLFSSNGLDALNLLPAATTGATTASFVLRGGEAVVEAQLQALTSNNRARILSAPRLVTLDNLAARITNSQNIYVQVDTVSPSGGYGGVGLQEIQTGLTLDITPSVLPAQSDRDQSLVRLNIRAENSSPASGIAGQIDVNSQEVQTNVLVPDSDTFVIGGLFDDSNINSENGVPFLKDIPLLGALFRDTNTQKSLGETIFFITPKIVDERSVLQSDIAVKEGSEEYIRRAQAELNAVSADANKSPPDVISTKTLEEDE